MKTIAMQLFIGMVFVTLPSAAGTVQVLGSDSETGLVSSVGYTLKTVGNNSISTSQSGFTPVSGQSNLSTSTGVDYINYLLSLPGGSTVTGATLDFSGLFSGLTYGSSLSGGAFFYQPSFSSILGAYTVTITSTLANVSLAGPSAVGYNLWPVFMNDILAGNAIDVTWTAVDTFSADTTTYGDTCKTCTEQFQVNNTANFSASNTANALNLTFSQGSGTTSTPEPATLSIAGLVLIGLSFAGRRKRA